MNADNKSKAKKVTLNLTVDKDVKDDFKELVPNISEWVEKRMRRFIRESKNKSKQEE